MEIAKTIKYKWNKEQLQQCLLALIQNKPRSGVELSKELNIARTTLQYHLNYLKASGLIERKKFNDELGKPNLWVAK